MIIYFRLSCYKYIDRNISCRVLALETETILFNVIHIQVFFTTKEAGTGLGLSIAARIVEKHGGALQYQTQVNHGTTFGIVLPRAESEDRKTS